MSRYVKNTFSYFLRKKIKSPLDLPEKPKAFECSILFVSLVVMCLFVLMLLLTSLNYN